MAKRLFDIIFSISALIALLPVMLLIAIIIKLSSPGPIFYIAKRAGINMKLINIYKFRTMHHGTDLDSAITKNKDPRVFKFGSILRKSKLDELPQFFNVLLGDISIVGPRPEDINIVQRYYNQDYLKTLDIKPGIASPGSIFNYTHYHKYLNESTDIEKDYVEIFLPIKLSLERVYIEKRNLIYDIEIIFRTIATIIKKVTGKTKYSFPKEYFEAINRGYIH